MALEDRRVWLLAGFLVLLFALGVPLSVIIFRVNYDYTLVTVAAGGAVLGLVSGVLGTFAVLRQQSLMGDALSHAALPGVAIAFLIAGRELPVLLVGAGLASWMAVYFISMLTRTTRIKQDAAMGIALAAFFALGMALLTYIQSRGDASQAGLKTFIFGQAAAMVRGDVLFISVVSLVIFGVLSLFWKEFKLITFDAEFAGANGMPVQSLNMLLSTLIVAAIVLGLQLAGVILMVGMLIAPAVAARQWARHLDQTVLLSAIIGAFAGAGGAILSATDEGMPTGPLIIVVAFGLMFVSIMFAPERGFAWQLWQQQGNRRRFAGQHVMRDIYQHALRHGDVYYPAPQDLLLSLRGRVARLGLKQLASQELVTQATDGRWQLTTNGAELARHDARNQDLWELYRKYGDELRLPAVSEDRQKDIAELLPQDAVQKLEMKLEGVSRS